MNLAKLTLPANAQKRAYVLAQTQHNGKLQRECNSRHCWGSNNFVVPIEIGIPYWYMDNSELLSLKLILRDKRHEFDSIIKGIGGFSQAKILLEEIKEVEKQIAQEEKGNPN